MTTIIAIFFLALVLSLGLTPVVGHVAKKHGLMDQPGSRKIHQAPIPRIGGAALYLSFFLPFLSIFFYKTVALEKIMLGGGAGLAAFAGGATVAFGLGMIDDIKRLRPHIKIIVQAGAAVTAYAGGIRITGIDLGWGMIELGIFSFPMTVFWFLLFINALNLIDGLDGLSAGVAFLVSMTLLIITVLNGNIGIALFLAALGGSTLGFLFYNFNPASIFMGDSGSYFLGYCLAALGIVGSMKSNTAVAIMIPVIAMGVPLVDTALAPIRRFFFGRNMFSPDGEHLHHRLLKKGLSHRMSVLWLYGVTIVLGLFALGLVHAKDERAALILLVVGAVVIVGVQQLGYMDFVRGQNIAYWLRSLSYEAGISRERRRFINLQAEIHGAEDINALWEKLCLAFEYLHFDLAELMLDNYGNAESESRQRLLWQRNGDCTPHRGREELLKNDYLFKLELPLTDRDDRAFGRLRLVKDLERDPLGHYTIRQVEHLRQMVGVAVRTMGYGRKSHHD